MKKILLMILSLILCLTMLTGCFGTDEVVDDADQGVAENNNPNNDVTPVNTANKQVVMDSFNKIDLSALAGVSVDYFELLDKMAFAAGFELEGTVDDEPGKVTADLAVKDSLIHFKTVGGPVEEDKDTMEAFVKITKEMIDLYMFEDDSEVEEDGIWQKQSMTMEEMGFNPSMATDMVNTVIEKVTIPKLEEKYLSEKNGMVLLSNEYLADLVLANVDLIVEVSQGAVEKESFDTKEGMLEEMAESGLEIYIGTGADCINKVAVALKVENGSRYNNVTEKYTTVYAELALTADGKALDALTVKCTADFGLGDVQYAPESVITLKPILDAEGAMVGLDFDATVYVGNVSGRAYPAEDGNTIKEMTTTHYLQKVVINADVNFANIGKENADIVTFSFKMANDKAIEVKSELNTENYEEKLISATDKADVDKKVSTSIEATLKSVNDKKITLDCKIGDDSFNMNITGELNYTVSDDKFEFNGALNIPETADVTFKGYVNVGEFTMPALPAVQ